MFHYRLPPTYEPDLMVLLDASHAEAFSQASGAALRVMEALGQSQSALGIIKTRGNYLIGRVEFLNVTILEPAAVEDFGSKLMLSEQRANVMMLRNACSGHLRTAMNNTMAPLGARTLHLVFHKGGPLFIISPANPDELYRLALVRLQGATNIRDERLCVEVNRASKATYRDVWGMLSKKHMEYLEVHRGPTKDVLDEPPAAGSSTSTSSATGGTSRLADAEDEIDEITEGDLESGDLAGLDEEDVEGISDDYMASPPPRQNAQSDPANFNIDELDGLEF